MESSRYQSKCKREGFQFKCLDKMIKKYRQAKKAIRCCGKVDSNQSFDCGNWELQDVTEVLFMNARFKKVEEQHPACRSDGSDRKLKNYAETSRMHGPIGKEALELITYAEDSLGKLAEHHAALNSAGCGDQNLKPTTEASLVVDELIRELGDSLFKDAAKYPVEGTTAQLVDSGPSPEEKATQLVESDPSPDSDKPQLQNSTKDLVLDEPTVQATTQPTSAQAVDRGDPKPRTPTKTPNVDGSALQVNKGLVIVKIGYVNMVCIMEPLAEKVAFFKQRRRQQIIRLLGSYVTPYAFSIIYDWTLCGFTKENGDRFVEVYRAASYLGVSDDFWSPFVKTVLTANKMQADFEKPNGEKSNGEKPNGECIL